MERGVGDVMERIGGRRAKGQRAPFMLQGWFRSKPRTMPPDVYEAGPRQVGRIYRLAGILAVAVALSVAPVAWLGHLGLGTSPAWACAVLLVAGLQIFYLVWMINAPDWVTAWIVMLVFAFVATGYAVAMAAAMTTPADHPLALGMGEVRYSAAPWCGAMVVVMGLGTWLCGRFSSRWRRQIQ